MRLRRAGSVAAYLAFTGLASLVALEPLVRVFHPQVLPQDVPDLWIQEPALRWRHRPDARVVANTGERDVLVCTDSIGDRVQCDAPARAGCAGRVLAIGDSYVEALAVPFDALVWTRIDRATGACTDNAGVAGYYLSQYIAATRERLAAPGARYDLVILSLYVGNDITDQAEQLPKSQDVQRRPIRLLPQTWSLEGLRDWFYPWNAWLESHSHAYVAVRFALRRFGDPGDVGLYGVPRALRLSQLTPSSQDETARGVRLVGEAAHAHGARLLVVVIPHRSQATDPDGARLLQGLPALVGDVDMELVSREFVPRIAALSAVDRVIDLLPALRADPDPALWGTFDAHLSPSGHARWAEAILPAVRELLAEGPPRASGP